MKRSGRSWKNGRGRERKRKSLTSSQPRPFPVLRSTMSRMWSRILILQSRAGLETIVVPTARNADGLPITGPVLARLSNLAAGATTASLEAGYGGLRYQRPLTLNSARALLTMQASDDGQKITIAATDWAFANCENKPRMHPSRQPTCSTGISSGCGTICVPCAITICASAACRDACCFAAAHFSCASYGELQWVRIQIAA